LNIPYFDTHCDTASEIMGRYGLRENPLHLDLARGSRYAPRGQVFACFADGGNYDDYTKQRDNLMAEFRKNRELAAFCRNGKDAEKAYKDGKTAAFISVEGAELLDCSIEKLERAKTDDGLCIVTLTWNHANPLSGSNCDRPEEGLTCLGKAFVRACDKFGVFVDVSHLSDKGFWDVMEITEKPVIATHSNSRAVHKHTRNLTDDMFRAIIETGGIVGINLYGEFLGAEPDIKSVLKHVEHFLNMGGETHLAVGADLDGCDILPAEIGGIQDMHRLYYEIENNFGKSIAENIYFNNAMTLLSRL